MDEVIIVGAGPVGLMLACELALAGVRPTVLDKRPEPSDLPKANGLVGQIVRMLDYRGLLERFAEGSPFAGRPPGFPFGPVPLRFAGLDDIPLRMVMVQQPRMERLLAERAAELGARIVRGTPVLGLTQDDDGVTVDLPGRRLRAHCAVGCDGGHSLVREQLGIAFPGTTDDEVLRLGHFKAGQVTGLSEQARMMGLEPGWNHTPHGRLLLTSLQPGIDIVGVREKGAAGPVTLADFQAAIRRVIGADLPLGEPIWLSSTVTQARLAERYRSGRVFLAGDAAHLFPAGGSALNVGLMDAVNLGWKLAAVLTGRAPVRLLDTYETERRPVGERTLAHTRAQAALERLTGEDGAALRDLLAEVFAFEQPARHLAHLLHGSDTRYGIPSEGVGEGMAAGHGSVVDADLVGRLAPDLRLSTGDGPTRVAELMRDGRPLLLDLGGGATLGGDWIRVVRARCDDPPADTLLIRPDGQVAWTGTAGLREAAAEWFEPA
jgi:2-polyprenyl-6-methoxyphenol hydroxylase-like FAD-dependent oxidoreductase